MNDNINKYKFLQNYEKYKIYNIYNIYNLHNYFLIIIFVYYYLLLLSFCLLLLFSSKEREIYKILIFLNIIYFSYSYIKIKQNI